MEGLGDFIYIIFFVIYVVYSIFKNFTKQKQPLEDMVEESPETDAKTLEDVLKEFTNPQNAEPHTHPIPSVVPIPHNPPLVEVVNKKIEVNTDEADNIFSYDDAVEDAIQYNAQKTKKAHSAIKNSATDAKKTLRKKKFLKNFNPAEAFVYSEIFNRKY